MSRLCVVKRDCAKYPQPEEYLEENNEVFLMMEEGFRMLHLDDEHYKTVDWNPLAKYVHPGDYVLIKPNMVMHYNPNGEGTDCLYTHPALVSAIIKYVAKALQGSGKIVVGDAPLQECIFEKLIEESGYKYVVDSYKKAGIDISLADFRNVKTIERDGVHYQQEENGHSGILVHVDEKSAFYGITEERAKNLRITNYDPRILGKHHSTFQHEYMVADEVLNADVIINMPKPKTHRKAGVTAALKNLVGINANKEYLPHHTLGSKDEGGDAYLDMDVFLSMANTVLDIKNVLVNEKEYALAKAAERLCVKLKAKNTGEKYWEGSWYGNDTIWRTIVDLNQILLYADKTGQLTNEKQRKIFIVGDMIVSGEKEGPLEPSPIYPNVIIMGDDPVQFDMLVSSLMGFDYNNIPSISMPQLDRIRDILTDKSNIDVVSNDENWNEGALSEIRERYSLQFMPSRGWLKKLGCKRLDELVNKLKGKSVHVFGAGEYGKFIAEELIKKHIKIVAFYDNNSDLWGKNIIDDVACMSPDEIDKRNVILIAVKSTFQDEIMNQIKDMGCKEVYFI